MTALPFDTLDYARKLEAAGVPVAQAEVHARALNEAFARGVASKEDVSNLELRMNARFDQVDAKFEQVDARFKQIDARFEQVDARFEQIDGRFAQVDDKLEQLESRLSTRIDSVKTELELNFNEKIDTLKWMFGVMVAMNAAVLIQLFFKH